MAADTVVGRPIQVDPQGLLSILALKNQGANPAELLGAVRPTLEMLPFWLRQQAKQRIVNSSRNFDSGVDAPGFYSFTPNNIRVPETEVWWIESYSLWGPLIGAGEAIYLNPAYMIPTVGTQRYNLLLPNAVLAPAGSAVACGARDFWLPPGAELGVYMAGMAGTVAVNADLRVARFVV